jgi:hypothetical protein
MERNYAEEVKNVYNNLYEELLYEPIDENIFDKIKNSMEMLLGSFYTIKCDAEINPTELIDSGCVKAIVSWQQNKHNISSIELYFGNKPADI